MHYFISRRLCRVFYIRSLLCMSSRHKTLRRFTRLATCNVRLVTYNLQPLPWNLSLNVYLGDLGSASPSTAPSWRSRSGPCTGRPAEGCTLQVTSYRLQTTDNKLELQVTRTAEGCTLQVTSYRLQVTGNKLRATSSRTGKKYRSTCGCASRTSISGSSP